MTILGNNHQSLNRTIGYTVREIMTHVDHLYFWPEDSDQQGEVVQRAKEDAVTYLPVRRDSQIVGLVRRDGLSVSEVIPLTADWLIAADTPILHLIELFAEPADRVFLVLQSSKVIGLVAPADLNKVPARASIYLLTAQFEAELAQLVRETLQEDEAALESYLSADNIKKIRDEHTKAKAGDLGLSLYYFLYLADLMTIVARHEELRKRFELRSRSHADSELDFTDLRNRVSHLTGLLLASRDELEIINAACSRIIRLSGMMNKQA